ncbi:MAG: hypothetical protein WDN28_12075 [Chthoniobacter sp.]
MLNGLGEVRIDAKSALPVDVEATINTPWLWKALAIGTPLDIGVVRKVKSAGYGSLHDYWEKESKLVSSTGYQDKERQRPRQDAEFMHVLPDIHRPKRNFLESPTPKFYVDVSRLLKFAHDTLFRTRARKTDALAIYRAPLALIRASPGTERTDERALLALDDVAYNESFYGYSAFGHKDADLLARYLHLFAHSELILHHALLTSAEIGIERPKLQKTDLDECPFIPLEHLNGEQRREVLALSKRLVRGDVTVFPEIDFFFGKLYGLDERDVEVIRDTLTVREPNDELGRRASQLPTAAESAAFRRASNPRCGRFSRRSTKSPMSQLGSCLVQARLSMRHSQCC